MSVAEFSAALKNRALQSWFSKESSGGGSASKSAQETYRLDNINVLANPVSIYRTGEQTSEKTAFVITKDTVRDLIVQFHNVQDQKVLDNLTEVYFSSFRAKNVGVAVSRKKITVGNNLPAVYFPNISFDTITKLVNNVLNIPSGELAKYYEKGHVVGLTTELLQVTASRIQKVDTTGSTGKAFLISQLDKVIEYYKRLDLDSANIQPAADVKLYASVNKKISKAGTTRYLVELQPRNVNQKSAREVQATIGSIRKLFSPGNVSEKTLLELIKKLQESVSDPKFQQDLLEMKSSPSFKDMIRNHIVSVLKDAPIEQSFVHKNVLIGSQKVPKVDTSAIRREASKKIAEAKKAKQSLLTKQSTKKPPEVQDSLASLQALLDRSLALQIEHNMGRGSESKILNYRTGRLAEAAKVERLSKSREGMITAFYTYMKNPYATFSEGGLQSSPRSRDPKLLISKSIRELGAKLAYNRMRAVLI